LDVAGGLLSVMVIVKFLGMIISTSVVIVVNITVMVTWIRFVLSLAHYVNCVICIPVFSNFVIDRLMGIGFLISG
jgi:hypothetical protein